MELGILHSIIGEYWKPVNGFSKYLISNKGRVYSLTSNRLLIPHLGNEGYLCVGLCNGEVTTKKIHRLVAEHFIDNPHGYSCVNHRDEIKVHNNVENLEWCTNSYNLSYGSRLLKVKESFIETGWSKSVEQYDKQGIFISCFSSVNEAARSIERTPGGITNCCKGLRKTAYGFIWKYKEAV